jgi:hypothetical protein
MENQIVRNEDLVWRRIEDEIVVIGNDGLAVHMLNKSAAYIWEQCDGTKSLDEIAVGLCEHFEVTPEEARADVQAAINKLEGMGLIHKTEGDPVQ